MAVTLKDIARELNLSITTVSRALSGYDDVAKETQQRVWALAEERGYVPDTTAQRLRKGRTDTLGFVIPTLDPRFSDPFFSDLLAGIGNEAAHNGFDLLVSTQAPGADEQRAYERLVESRRVDGLVVVRTRHQDERIQYLVKRQFPFIAFGRSDLEVTFPYLDVDSGAGFVELVRHLIELGHRRIACISAAPRFMFVTHRLEGYRRALTEHGLPFEEALLLEGDLTQKGGYAAGGRLLDLPNPPSAIVCVNDLTALGAMRAAQERDLVVGRDISITGYDDVFLAENAHPPLTTVHQPIGYIGQRVCQMLLSLIRGEVLDQPQILLTPHLVARQSTGPAPERATAALPPGP